MFEFTLSYAYRETELIWDPHELYRFLAAPEGEVVNGMCCLASCWYTAEEQVPSLGHTNKVIGVFVACGGRMHLYSYLDNLGERATRKVLYLYIRTANRL